MICHFTLSSLWKLVGERILENSMVISSFAHKQNHMSDCSTLIHYYKVSVCISHENIMYYMEQKWYFDCVVLCNTTWATVFRYSVCHYQTWAQTSAYIPVHGMTIAIDTIDKEHWQDFLNTHWCQVIAWLFRIISGKDQTLPKEELI